MLYVSRYVSRDTYGIVDTDDGQEEIVSEEELEGICCDLCLPVLGVTVYSGAACRYVESILPYQPSWTLTQLQIKTKVLRGVEVCTYQDMVTNVRWNNADIVAPVRIRLSDFGDLCGACILSGNTHARLHKITLVLDDNITFGSKVFKLRKDDTYMGRDGIGVMVDLRDMHDDIMVERAYRSFFNGDLVNLNSSIIDYEDRKGVMLERLRCYHAVCE